jgi:hypothetical protein
LTYVLIGKQKVPIFPCFCPETPENRSGNWQSWVFSRAAEAAGKHSALAPAEERIPERRSPVINSIPGTMEG